MVRVNQYDVAELECSALGIPRPVISWFVSHDNQNVSLTTGGSVTIDDPVPSDNFPLAVNSTLVINKTLDGDSGIYYCVANSLPGSDSQGIDLEIQGK